MKIKVNVHINEQLYEPQREEHLREVVRGYLRSKGVPVSEFSDSNHKNQYWFEVV